MEMTNFLLNNLQFSAPNINKNVINNTTKSNSSSFDNQYQNYKSKYEANDNVKNNNNKNIKKDNINKNDEKKTDIKDETVKNKNSEKKDNSSKIDNSKKTNENSNVNNDDKLDIDKDEVSKKVIDEISEKLGISIEEINSILQQLNIDVLSLVDTQNLNSFVQKLLNIDNPIDMIVLPQAKEVYKTLSSIIQTNKDDIENAVKIQDIIKQLPTEETATTNKPIENNANVLSSNSNSLKTTNINKETVKTDDTQIQEQEIPVIEIKNETKGNEQSKGNLNNNNTNQNYNTNTQIPVANENYNYANSFNAVNIQQQAVADKIVANNISNTQGTKDIYQIINQIVEKIKVDIKPDISEMKLILKPDHLGELSLKITTENNIITAQFVAENQQVKEVLQSNFSNLKDTLQQLGLIVNNISVSVGQQNSQAKQQFEQNQEKSKRRMSKIIEGMDALGDVDVVYNEDYANPYDLSDNQVDYMA